MLEFTPAALACANGESNFPAPVQPVTSEPFPDSPPTLDWECGDVNRMPLPVRDPMQAKSEPALRLATSEPVQAPPGEAALRLTDAHVERNPGTPLDLDIIRGLRVNRSAVERRAATIPTRRTVKKEWQGRGARAAITMKAPTPPPRATTP